jgi:hypothetical protein
MNRVYRIAICVLALMACALVASADEWRRGRAFVDAVDPAARTITIDGEVYRVPASCQIYQESGVIASLSDIRGIDDSSELLIPTNAVDFVRFEALKSSRRWDMVDLVILESPAQ